jgi:hypothetical protein
MDSGFTFKELSLDNNSLCNCEMVLECNSGMYRLYLLRFTDCAGFRAMAVSFNSCRVDNKNHWDAEDLIVDELFTVTAYFDGVRHLEFNRNDKDMEGYLYCTNMDGLISLLSKVREIEKEICRDCDD